jgi:EAL domain-containing protein (putative c-di-GMP-specific phosphodiesterase class I)
LGGDEFGVLLEIMDDDSEAETIAGRLLEILQPPFQIAGRDLRITASIGVAKSDGSRGVDELLRNADTAMYVAKDAGKGTMRAFEDGMHRCVLDRLELTGEMQRALARDEFELHYQPIVDLQTGQINSTEALVRWAHPTRGRLAPGQFIGLADETGLIVPPGMWVLDSACAQAAIWQRTFPARILNMNVNVSIRQLHDPSFPLTVAETLRESGLAERLVLETTESLLPEDGDEIIAQLHKLKALGVLIAVDDFGTGYSALSRLRAYPIDILKIDRSFIEGIELDAGKEQLVAGIVNLGESLHMSVVAEGIEEPEQADQLRQMRSPLGQGYLFSRPVTCHQLQALLESGKPLSRRGPVNAQQNPRRPERHPGIRWRGRRKLVAGRELRSRRMCLTPTSRSCRQRDTSVAPVSRMSSTTTARRVGQPTRPSCSTRAGVRRSRERPRGRGKSERTSAWLAQPPMSALIVMALTANLQSTRPFARVPRTASVRRSHASSPASGGHPCPLAARSGHY